MISPTGSASSVNRILNFYSQKLEIICVYLLFLGFFDTNLFFLTGAMKAASYGMIFFLITLRWKQCIYVATKDISLLLLVGIAIFSYFWSAAPGYTLNESKSFIREVLFGVYLAAQYKPKELFRIFIWMLGLAVVINWIFSISVIAIGQPLLAIADTNDENSWTGLLLHKQYLGRMVMHAAILFLLSALTYRRWRWMMWGEFSLSAILLFLSKSKSSWICFLTGLILLPIFKFAKLHYKLRTIIYVLTVLLGGSIALILFGNLETIVVNILHKPLDFNGRFEIWGLAMESALKRPWLGYGYSGFWTSNYGQYIFNDTWATLTDATRLHAHNGFIDLFLQLGIVGMLIFAINFLAVLWRVINLIHVTKTVESFWMLEFLILGFLMQVTETLTFMSNTTLCAVYISIVLSTILWEERIKSNASKLESYSDPRLLKEVGDL